MNVGQRRLAPVEIWKPDQLSRDMSWSASYVSHLPKKSKIFHAKRCNQRERPKKESKSGRNQVAETPGQAYIEVMEEIRTGDTVKCSYKVWTGTVTRVFVKNDREYATFKAQDGKSHTFETFTLIKVA